MLKNWNDKLVDTVTVKEGMANLEVKVVGIFGDQERIHTAVVLIEIREASGRNHEIQCENGCCVLPMYLRAKYLEATSSRHLSFLALSLFSLSLSLALTSDSSNQECVRTQITHLRY